MKLLKRFTLLGACCALVSCGGGGGSSSTSSGPITLSGHVIDGYIEGAIVCLDLNSNNQCDTGEPSTVSKADGSYTLPSYAGSIAGLRVVAQIPVGAVDLDTGPITEPYSLLAPAAASATVTPLSTLVSSTISSAGGEAALTIGEAITSVAVRTGILPENLLAFDYKAKGDTTTAQVAAVTASAIAKVVNTVSNDPAIKNAGLKEGEILKAALVQVKAEVLPQLVVEGKATQAAITNPSQAAATAVQNAEISGKVQNIVVATKAGDGTVAQMRDIFKQGLVIAQSDSGDYINSAGVRVDGYWRGYSNELVVEYLQTDGGKLPPYKRFVLVGDKWYRTYENGRAYTYNGTTWEPVPAQDEDLPDSLQPTYDQNCLTIPQNRLNTVSERFCAVQKDLSNRSIREFITDLCNDPNAAPTCNNSVFPAGSYAYDLSRSNSSTLPDTEYPGFFQLWVSEEWNGYCTTSTGNSCTSNSGTIFDFIEWTRIKNGNGNFQFTGSSCNVPFRIASYDASSKTGVINWSSNRDGGCGGNLNYSAFSVVETSNFQVIRKGGKDVMIVPTPAIYRANNPSEDMPYMIFATLQRFDGVTGVWNGSYYPVNFKSSIPFTGNLNTNTQILNKTAFDAILIQARATPYPYDGKHSSGTYNRPK